MFYSIIKLKLKKGILNRLLKKKNTIPKFEFIKSYKFKDKYFSKTKKWIWIKQDQIALLEKDENGIIKAITFSDLPIELKPEFKEMNVYRKSYD